MTSAILNSRDLSARVLGNRFGRGASNRRWGTGRYGQRTSPHFWTTRSGDREGTSRLGRRVVQQSLINGSLVLRLGHPPIHLHRSRAPLRCLLYLWWPAANLEPGLKVLSWAPHPRRGATRQIRSDHSESVAVLNLLREREGQLWKDSPKRAAAASPNAQRGSQLQFALMGTVCSVQLGERALSESASWILCRWRARVDGNWHYRGGIE
jgi:hypothetical protein